jgi:hypothetical protein
MSFQNLPAQIIILLVGWVFTLYLDYRSKHRTEAIKRKDAIVSRIENLADWIDKEIAKTHFDATRLESSLAGNLTQTELKILQLNSHLKTDLLDPSRLSAIRDIDVANKIIIPELSFKIRGASSDIIEYIEQASDKYFFQKNKKTQTLQHYSPKIGYCIFTALITTSLLILHDISQNREIVTPPLNKFLNPPEKTQEVHSITCKYKPPTSTSKNSQHTDPDAEFLSCSHIKN